MNAHKPGPTPEDKSGIARTVPDLLRKSLARVRPLPTSDSGGPTPRSPTSTASESRRAQEAGLDDSFDMSASDEWTIREIAEICWEAASNDPDKFKSQHLPDSEVDVQRRWPSVGRTRRVLG